MVHVPSLIFHDNFFETTCAELFIECHGCTPGLMQEYQDNILIKPSALSINEAAERDVGDNLHDKSMSSRSILHTLTKNSQTHLCVRKTMTVHKTKLHASE